MKDVKTKFNEYVSFGTTPFDTTPEANTEDGVLDLPTVSLDGNYTLDDLRAIMKEMVSRGELGRVKRHLLFAGYFFDELGGMHDLKRDFIRLESAMAAGRLMEKRGYEQNGCDWWHVFDSEQGKIVAHSGYCHSCPNGGDYVEQDRSFDKP